MDKLITKVKSNLEKISIKNKSVLIALSGGKDSITLLHSLLTLQNDLEIKISVAYVNHNLRGKESAEEEKFVIKLISKLKLPFYKLKIREECWKDLKNESIEMAARRLRYNFFNQIANENKIDYIMTAHNFNDKIETFFLQILRGGGVDTLKSIPFRINNIIRPLINITREEIDDFIIKNDFPYIEDSSNKKNIYKRNIIRNEVLPLFRDIHQEYEKSFNHVFDFIEEEQKLINFLAKRQYKKILIYNSPEKICINKNKYSVLPVVIQKTIIKLILKEMNYPVKPSLYMLENLSGKKEKYNYKRSNFYSSSNPDYIIFINTEKLKFLKNTINVNELPFEYKDDKLIVQIKRESIDDPRAGFNFKLDSECLPIKIRHLNIDDYIYINEKNKKYLIRILKDLKTPKPLYKEAIVLETKDNRIIGFFLNNYFRVSKEFYINDIEKENAVFNIAYYK